MREVEDILQAKAAPLGYQLITADLKNRIDVLSAAPMLPTLSPTFSSRMMPASTPRFWESPRKLRSISWSSDRIGPAMKDYLLGTYAARVVRHAHCSVLVARE
jgi:hypothetical protein